MTTVGYGDKYPVTGFGQGVAVVMMIFGVGLIGVLTATVASYFVGQDLGKAQTERDQMQAELRAARSEREMLTQRLDEMHGLLLNALGTASGVGDDRLSQPEIVEGPPG